MHINALKDLLCNLVLFFDIVKAPIEKSLSTGTDEAVELKISRATFDNVG